MLIHALSALLIGIVVLTGSAHAEPEVFSKAGYEADRAAAVEGEKLHVLYFTASWCPPCKQMKKTTWVDKNLTTWLDEHAIVTAIDVDEKREIAEEYGISAMPTMIVLRGSEEVGRTVGYQGPDQFREWLIKAEAGELPAFVQQTPEEIYNEAFESARESGKRIRGFQDRLREAEGALYQESVSYEEVTAQFASIFSELMEAGLIDIWADCRFTVGYLVYVHPPAGVTFISLRDQLEKDLRGGQVSWDKLSGWASLSAALGDEDRILSWLERRVEVGVSVPSSHLIHELAVEVATDARRFDLLRGITDPVYECRKIDNETDYMLMSLGSSEYFAEMNGEQKEIFRQDLIETRRYSMASQYAIALGIGDAEAVNKIQMIVFSKDDTPEARQMLWETAVDMGAAWSERPE